MGTPLYDLLNNGRTSLLNMIHSLKETVDLNDCQVAFPPSVSVQQEDLLAILVTVSSVLRPIHHQF